MNAHSHLGSNYQLVVDEDSKYAPPSHSNSHSHFIASNDFEQNMNRNVTDLDASGDFVYIAEDYGEPWSDATGGAEGAIPLSQLKELDLGLDLGVGVGLTDINGVNNGGGDGNNDEVQLNRATQGEGDVELPAINMNIKVRPSSAN